MTSDLTVVFDLCKYRELDDITNFPQKIANKIKIKTHRKEQMRALFSQTALGCHWSMLAQNS